MSTHEHRTKEEFSPCLVMFLVSYTRLANWVTGKNHQKINQIDTYITGVARATSSQLCLILILVHYSCKSTLFNYEERVQSRFSPLSNLNCRLIDLTNNQKLDEEQTNNKFLCCKLCRSWFPSDIRMQLYIILTSEQEGRMTELIEQVTRLLEIAPGE